MDNAKKLEIIQKIINSNKIVEKNKNDVDKTKIWYIQSVLYGVFEEEEIQWLWEE